MGYYARQHDDRRYWLVASTFEQNGYTYFGCVAYLAVVDDFGNLVRVRPL